MLTEKEIATALTDALRKKFIEPDGKDPNLSPADAEKRKLAFRKIFTGMKLLAEINSLDACITADLIDQCVLKSDLQKVYNSMHQAWEHALTQPEVKLPKNVPNYMLHKTFRADPGEFEAFERDLKARVAKQQAGD